MCALYTLRSLYFVPKKMKNSPSQSGKTKAGPISTKRKQAGSENPACYKKMEFVSGALCFVLCALCFVLCALCFVLRR
ncbi:MAG TPA: hypothetical protein PLB18_19200, partial [Acidobacteriota bacterium]|nr:hypothetical protein [Acidobacteriota bacterium]